MRHQCTACRREFVDDSASLPESDRVYCVFCGAPIGLLGPDRAPRGAVPFGNVRRSAGAALGIIRANDSGFPDTLRQFAIARRELAAGNRGDTLRPVAREELATGIGAAHGGLSAQPLRRHAAFLLALLGGFAAGVTIAAGVSRDGRAPEPPSAGLSQPAVAKAASPPSAAPPAEPASSPSVCTPAPASAAVPKTVKDALDRSWLLDRARYHQRAYRLDKAEVAYRRVLALAPRDSEALAGLGELELLRGAPEQATQRFEQALQFNEHYVPAKVGVADIRYQAGRAQEARAAYQDIVKQHSPDAYPPYVVQRSASAVFPDCSE